VKPAEGRPVSRAVFIGVGAFLLYAAIPIVIMVVLAFLASPRSTGTDWALAPVCPSERIAQTALNWPLLPLCVPAC